MGQTSRQTVEAGFSRLKLCEALPDVQCTQPSDTHTLIKHTPEVYRPQTLTHKLHDLLATAYHSLTLKPHPSGIHSNIILQSEFRYSSFWLYVCVCVLNMHLNACMSLKLFAFCRCENFLSLFTVSHSSSNTYRYASKGARILYLPTQTCLLEGYREGVWSSAKTINSK